MPQFDDSLSTDRMKELRRKEEEGLIRALSKKYGIQYVDLRGVTIDPEALPLIAEDAARSAGIVAFERHRQQVSVAIKNPNNKETRAIIKSLEEDGWQVTIFMTSTISLEHAWDRYSDQIESTASKKGVLDLDPDRIATLMPKLATLPAVASHLEEIRRTGGARRISDALETLFAGGLRLNASDIHIEPAETDARVRYRLNGVLEDTATIDRSLYEHLISRLKLLSGLHLNVHDEAQDGRFTFTAGEQDVEVRSSVIPGASGESMVMRLLDPTVAAFQIDSLGLSPKLRSVIDNELQRPNGMIITTGPTGSGKTTALYAFLREKHQPGVKIITIENPVEYKLEGIVQTQTDDEYTFSSGLRSILRQDPDIIMVGEIRDRDVAETAIHAAQTGHLVFSTLHTNNAAGAFPRLIDLGVDSRVIGTAINLILGQRLVRVLCNECKQARPATTKESQLITTILATHPDTPGVPDPLTLYEPAGCPVCNHTGFVGRAAVFEAIAIDTAVEEAVLRDPREHIIMEAAKPQGIPTMAEDGIWKVINGVTSLAELQRVVDLSHTRSGDAAAPPAADTDAEFTNHIV